MMTERRLTTIDEALAELERLRATLQALRLMPEVMPAHLIDLAMTKVLRELNFDERTDGPLGLRYITNDVAGFNRIAVAWSREYLWHRCALTVRVWGENRPASEFEGSSWYDMVALKILEIPYKAVTDDPEFARTLFALISDPTGFEPFQESGTLGEYRALKYPQPGEAHGWPGAALAYTAQIGKGDTTEAQVAREFAQHGLAIGEPCNVKSGELLTAEQRTACDALDKGAFW